MGLGRNMQGASECWQLSDNYKLFQLFTYNMYSILLCNFQSKIRFKKKCGDLISTVRWVPLVIYELYSGVICWSILETPCYVGSLGLSSRAALVLQQRLFQPPAWGVTPGLLEFWDPNQAKESWRLSAHRAHRVTGYRAMVEYPLPQLRLESSCPGMVSPSSEDKPQSICGSWKWTVTQQQRAEKGIFESTSYTVFSKFLL